MSDKYTFNCEISNVGWRLPDDFPVVVDQKNNVVARFSDPVWPLHGAEMKPVPINFGDGPKVLKSGKIDSENAYLLRRIVAMWLFGARAYESASTVQAYVVALRPIFVLCSKKRILASDLHLHPLIEDVIPSVICPSKANDALMLLHGLYNRKDELRFQLLNNFGLKRLSAALPDHQAHQTVYIPPRIWLYQLNRLKEFLDEFIKNSENIEKCFDHCVEAYIDYCGGPRPAFERGRYKTKSGSFGSKLENEKVLAHFSIVAEKFGILELITKWSGNQFREKLILPNFSSYLTAATRISAAYIANLSLMRISEVWNLKEDCLIIEADDEFGPIYTLSGTTAKTIKDDDARWITSPSVVVAIDVARRVSHMRAACARANPKLAALTEYKGDQRLFLTAYEPWSQRYGMNAGLHSPRTYPSYSSVISAHPRIFSIDEIRITSEDLDIANLVNSDLDRKIYAVGEVWPFAWHQLRRTGAVNMQSSGLVSDPSLQYQLKHERRIMSLFYGRGYGKLRLRQDAATKYVRTMYEAIGKKMVSIAEDVFVSPHGPERKSEILKMVSGKDHRYLTEAAKNGTIAWRETLFGGCTKKGECSFGGIDNVIRCGGGDGKSPCADAIFDKRKLPTILELRNLVEERLECAEPKSPLHESLSFQLSSIQRTLRAIE